MAIRRFFRRRAWDRERAREIETHIAEMADDLRARGVAPDEAERRARARFGNPRSVREEIYEMNSIPLIENLTRDARYALRVLRRSPGFALTAILTLAVAIGANTAVFSLVDAVLLRPLPYPQPDQLFNAEQVSQSPRGVSAGLGIDGARWEAFAKHVKSADIAVYSDSRAGANVAAGVQAINARQQRVGAGYFRVLQVPPALGREFTPEEDRAGGPNAIILSDGLWKRAFAGNAGILNTSVLVRGEPHTVVGIMPASFRGSMDVDMWTPLRASRLGQGGGANFAAILRVTGHPEQVESELNAALRSLQLDLPEDLNVWFRLAPLKQLMTLGHRDPLFSMWAAVGLVLLIACVNLAGLLLSRARTRTHEISTRMALGSGRRAVVRQLLVESLIIAIAGGLAGIAIGYLMLTGVQALSRDQYELWQHVSLDWRAIGVTAAISLGAALVFGLVPALQASRLDVQAGLREGGTRGASAATGRTRRLLVVGEVALGVVLLVGAGLLTRTFMALQNLDPGFDLTNIVTGTASLEDKRYRTREPIEQLFDRSLERIASIPGVESAAVSLGLPYQRILNLGFAPLDGPQAADEDRDFMANVTYVTPRYFETLRIPVKAGRGVTPADRADTTRIIVVNETFAREYYPEGAIGRRIRMAGGETREIVGIVGDVQQRNPGFGNGNRFDPIRPTPVVYLPSSQTPSGTFALVHTWFTPTWIVRTSGPIAGIEQQMRLAVAEVDPQLPLASVRSMSEVRSLATASQRFMMVLAVMLGAASMLLAAIGIHGLISSSINERKREIGIRMALGSTAGQAVRVLAWPGILLTILGIVIGGLLARGLTRYISTLLWGVQPTDPMTFAAVGALLLLVAIAASVLPALRIMRWDPARTLRSW